MRNKTKPKPNKTKPIPSKKQSNGWVNCEVECPIKMKEYLTWDGVRVSTDLWEVSKGYHGWAGCITHWMELPKPPK